MAERRKLMIIGAHPDDCEHSSGGFAALCAQEGWQVHFCAVTNGDAGHHEMRPKPLAARRLKEARKAAGRIGATYETLGEHDGRLFVNDTSTRKVVCAIRRFSPDVLVAPRQFGYHRDHRNAGQLVLDASFVLQVPLVYPKVKPMVRMPIILYACDFFSEVSPFRPHLVIDTTKVEDVRIRMLRDHFCQYSEWIPWLNGRKECGQKHPLTNPEELTAMLRRHPRGTAKAFAKELGLKYRHRRKIVAAEAFQLSEVGTRVSTLELARLFPF